MNTIPTPAAPQSGARPILRVVCSYCRDVVVEGSAPTPVSHGVCDPCFRREMASIDAVAEASQSRAEAYAG